MSQLLEIHSGSNQARFHNFKEGNDDSSANPPRSVIKKKPVGPQCLHLLILAKNAVDQDRDPVAAVRSAL